MDTCARCTEPVHRASAHAWLPPVCARGSAPRVSAPAPRAMLACCEGADSSTGAAGTAPDNLRRERGERGNIELGEVLNQKAAVDLLLLLLLALLLLLLPLHLLLRRRLPSLGRLPLHFLLSLHPADTHAHQSRGRSTAARTRGGRRCPASVPSTARAPRAPGRLHTRLLAHRAERAEPAACGCMPRACGRGAARRPVQGACTAPAAAECDVRTRKCAPSRGRGGEGGSAAGAAPWWIKEDAVRWPRAPPTLDLVKPSRRSAPVRQHSPRAEMVRELGSSSVVFPFLPKIPPTINPWILRAQSIIHCMARGGG